MSELLKGVRKKDDRFPALSLWGCSLWGKNFLTAGHGVARRPRQEAHTPPPTARASWPALGPSPLKPTPSQVSLPMALAPANIHWGLQQS